VASKSASRGCQTQVQVSGLAMVMDCSVPPHTPDGRSCDPADYRGFENLGHCYEGKADLILIGSSRPCQTDDDCAVAKGQSEICGASLGFCVSTDDLRIGSRNPCLVADAGTACAQGETCAASHLNSCGHLLNPFGDYRVAVNDYVANGGSGFQMLQFNTAKVNTGISLRDSVVDYLQRLDDPAFEGPYTCTGTPSANTCRGAIRCDDPRFGTDDKGKPFDPYLNPFNAVNPDIAFRYCPGQTTLGACFGHMSCVLPHNQATDGHIRPRFQ
jgi:hypothetical protein